MNQVAPYTGHLFEGCWHRIDRAEAHRQEAVATWNTFIETEPFDSVFDLDANGQGQIWIDIRTGPPAILSVLMGEYFYNLRVALDYAVYDTAIHDSGKNPPPNAQFLQFPVCATPETWRTSQHILGPLSDKHRRWVDQIQPYQREGGPLGSPLYWLNDIARKDRHRSLQVTGAHLAEANPIIQAEKADAILFEDLPAKGLLVQTGTVITRFQVIPYEPGDPVEANPNSALDIEIQEFLSRDPGHEWLTLPLQERLLMIALQVKMMVGVLERDCTGETRFTGLIPQEEIE